MTKVLVIEDQSIFQNVYQAVLERSDLEVITALDGQAGLNLAAEHKPDIILLDMMMPKLNGLQFLQAFEPKKHPETKVIVFSNLDLADQKQAALDLGAIKYLTKAAYFTPKQLLAAIQELL